MRQPLAEVVQPHHFQQLVRVSLNGPTVINREPLLVGQYRIRDVRQGPDGFVYVLTDETAGALLKIEP